MTHSVPASSDRAPAVAPATRNPGVPFDAAWFEEARVNRSATQRRATTLAPRRSVKKDHQAAWLLRAVTMIDLTTLAGDDTAGRVRRLCAKARRPVREDLLAALGMADAGLTVGAVCVYPTMVPHAVRALEGSGVPVASVASGFPSGLMPMPQRLAEVRWAVDAGAAEIDVVITRELVLTGRWEALYDEVAAFRDAVGEAHLKVILATGELGTLAEVYKASMIAMMAGADFVKTSTGKEPTNATLEVGLVMSRAVRAYQERTGVRVGFKPAGGIRQAKEALAWLALIKDELGDAWLTADAFRFGASSLLGDIERQLEHHVTGRYAAAHHQPLA
ncbi:MAG: deoxyribose-phosphate aldolase [Trueperaceae bacterium]|nr:deoxyribose-phosphate aldolase [Trueperaceae bacterium]